jgi:hypothetical protein
MSTRHRLGAGTGRVSKGVHMRGVHKACLRSCQGGDAVWRLWQAVVAVVVAWLGPSRNAADRASQWLFDLGAVSYPLAAAPRRATCTYQRMLLTHEQAL